MVKVVGVRFRTAGKVYYFDPVNFEIRKGDHVIVETARGVEYGTVSCEIMELEDERITQPLKPVLRVATERDDKQEAENRMKEKEAYKVCLEKIRKHELEMKLIDAEYTFDNNKVLFYFTADGRIDFRELVKDLASVFKTRIELRQIGVRDETKILGGIGICGRALCCHTFLPEFAPVSIKMAKEQNLSLNPTKISGVCGRLMCCLKNEQETYEELNRKLPSIGDIVDTNDELVGEVHSVSVLRQMVKVLVDVGDEKEIHEYKVDEITVKKHHNRKDKNQEEAESAALKELEKLERQDQAESQEKPEKQAKYDKKDRADRNNKGDRGQKQDRNNKNKRPNRPEKSEHLDNKNGKTDKPDKPRHNKGFKGQKEGKGKVHENRAETNGTT